MRALLPALLFCVVAGCADPFIEATTILGDTRDTQGPYTVQTVAVGVDQYDLVQLYYSVDDDDPDAFVPLVMEEGREDDGIHEGERFSRGIPGQPPGSEILYFVAIQRNGEHVAEDPVGGDLRPFVFRVLP